MDASGKTFVLPAPRRLRAMVVYGVLLAAAVGVFLLIRAYGETLSAPAREGGEASVGPGATDSGIGSVLLVLAVVLILGRLVGGLFVRLGQPAVLGEVVAGLLLGPSVLGKVAPQAAAFLLPNSAVPLLGVVAQLGVILYMFLVGLELNPGVLRRQVRASLAISLASIVVPFLLGAALALGLYPRLSSADVPFTSFALFLGIALSVTAFPVLARILNDCRMHRTELGLLSLTCAATQDVLAWCLLALVVGVVQARLTGAFLVPLLVAGYLGFMFLVVRPVAERLAARYDQRRPSSGVVALLFVALLLSALATEAIGVHAIFGAFLLGAVIPAESTVARAFGGKLEDLATVLLLPAFFALTGMRTEIGLISGAEQWLVCGLLVVAATVGKLGGVWAAARLVGLGWRESAALGALMNTRGLMELIVLNIGLDLKVISPTLFTMLVVMALVTTLMTAPLLRRLAPGTTVSGEAADPPSVRSIET